MRPAAQVHPREAYRRLAAQYDQAPNPVLALERTTLPALLPALQRSLVIDAAAGTGYWARYCAARGSRAVAVDFCAPMLVRAPRPAALADIARLPFPDAVADATICAFGLGYAPQCLPELARVTRSGGVVLASDLHPAALRHGWTRTFRRGGESFEVAHCPYEFRDLETPELVLDALIEPSFGDAEREIFERAGKLAEFESARLEPAIFVARWARL